ALLSAWARASRRARALRRQHARTMRSRCPDQGAPPPAQALPPRPTWAAAPRALPSSPLPAQASAPPLAPGAAAPGFAPPPGGAAQVLPQPRERAAVLMARASPRPRGRAEGRQAQVLPRRRERLVVAMARASPRPREPAVVRPPQASQLPPVWAPAPRARPAEVRQPARQGAMPRAMRAARRL